MRRKDVEISREDSAFMARIKALPGVVEIKKIPVTGTWEGKYKIRFLQELNHETPEAGYFLQTLYLNHKDFERPMVVVTEGYGAGYGEIPMYQTEIAGIVDGNQLIIEHRYFRESVPEDMDWDYLTVANAATDQHEVIESFKALYDEKWISTGISKGGQTVMFHKSLYPDDVDFSIPYVCPLNFGVEDGRHEPYIAKNGKRSDRKAIKAFQLEALQRKDSLMPLFNKFILENELVFRIPAEEVYDLCVLEYSFAFWQWLADTEKIPGAEASNEEIFNHLMAVASADYFAESDYFLPFFIQAAREIGYYGYDTGDFEKYLSLPNADGYLCKVFLPDSLHYEYDASVMESVQDYFEENDPE
ncbi:MAG: S28 family serine protease [Bacteroidota bacterium]|nr:S28 family serine protease [Bacteroidota bacterium]